MPTPKEGESKQDFISRCIPIVMDEGHTQEEAKGKCYGLWENHQKSAEGIVRRVGLEPIRSFKTADGKTRYRAHAVRFGNEDELDWYGTFFDAETMFHLDWFKSRPWLYDHTMNPMMGQVRIGDWVDWEITEEGVFFIGELLDHFKYKDAVEELLNRGVLYPSTGTLSYVMDWDWGTGHMKEWPIVELSSTTSPAEYRMEPMEPEVRAAIRSLRGGVQVGDKQREGFLSMLLGNREAETEQDTEGEVQDTAPETETEETAPEQEQGIGLNEVVEAVADALNIGDLFTAIEMLDSRMQQLSVELAQVRDAHNQVAASAEQMVKDALATRDSKGWLDGLYVASRDAPARDPDSAADAQDSAPRDRMSKAEVEAAGGPVAIIQRQQQAARQ